MADSARDFRGNDRFLIRRRLGAGGAGVVYEAYDRERQESVALKTLLRTNATGIYRFKREFRTLAGVAHQNLVSLYELIATDETWFFTMELIDGVSFLDHVRAPTASGANYGRTRAALGQLARGLCALHAAGRLHRDLKPSNVLVTRAGRVVILDFGIAAELGTADAHLRTVEDGLCGTVAYMAPEQFLGEQTTAASDWYAVGTMLYEALVGHLPFKGDSIQILASKVLGEFAHPEALARVAPPDLVALTLALLDRSAAARPTGEDVLRRLGVANRIERPIARFMLGDDSSLVGRREHMQALESAFATVRDGQHVSMYVHGPSGIGKSRLVEQFTSTIARQDGAVVLTGKCYVRESVPNKALDGVIDSLSRYLRGLDPGDVVGLMPDDVSALLKVFPVLERVEAIADGPHPESVVGDARELRRRAVAAFRTLLSTLAHRQPLVLSIDDLQWADTASANLLDDLLAPPDAPPLLLIASFRTEELRSHPFLQRAIGRVDDVVHRELRLDRLTTSESLTLTRRLLDADAASTPTDVLARIALESAGVPFLIEQLTHFVQRGRGPVPVQGVRLRDMFDASIRELPPGTRELLEVLTVAASPVDAGAACQAAGCPDSERELASVLSAAQLVRNSGAPDQIELYHDRIRETLAATLDTGATRTIHRRLAEALTQRRIDDPDALYVHFAAAGDAARAAVHAARAAERAAATLAFGRAAFFYREALALGAPDAPERGRLTASLADALANDGRPADAARTYLEAASASSGELALDYRRRAAEQLLMGGHTDDGLQVIDGLLRTVGLVLPTTSWRVLASFVLRRLSLRLRGTRVVERDERDVSPDLLLRIDVCWTCAAGLGLTEIIRASLFQTVHMLLALRAGEPRRLARALALDAGFSAAPGAPARAVAATRVARAREAAVRIGHPYAIGLSTLTAGIAAYLVGEWRAASRAAADAERVLWEHATGVMWEVTSAQSYRLGALTYLGEIAEVTRAVPALLADAQDRGNLYAATEVRTRQNIVWLASDEPDRARHEVTEALAHWSSTSYYRQHYNALRALSQIDLYIGDGQAAWRRLVEQWPALRRSLMLRVQVLRIEAWSLQARAALQVARAGQERAAMLVAAERLTRKIERERVAWSAPFVPLARAAMADMRGERTRAVELLDAAIGGFERVDMGLHAAVARRRLGELTGAAALVGAADRWMADQRIMNPAAIAELLAPGFELRGP
jgi:serine/threonine protein kinase